MWRPRRVRDLKGEFVQKQSRSGSKTRASGAGKARPQPLPSSISAGRHELKHTAILDAALMLFSRYGLHGTSVDQIAEAAKVSKANLLYHFRSKDDVYRAVLGRLLDGWLAPLRTISAEQDPGLAIKDYIRRKIEFSREQPEASRLFCLEIVSGAPLIGDEIRSALKQLVDTKAKVIRSWIADGRLRPTDPYHLIFAIWAITQHYADFAVQIEGITGRRITDDDYREEAIHQIQSIILNGISLHAPD